MHVRARETRYLFTKS